MKKTLAVLTLTGLFTLPLTTGVFAAGRAFTPSVQAKAAPARVELREENSEAVVAIIYDADRNEVMGVPDSGLIVTALAEAEDADETIREALLSTYEEILSLPSLRDMPLDLAGALAERGSDLTPEELVIRDLFDVSLTGKHLDAFSLAGNVIDITFDLGMAADALLIVSVRCGSEWTLVPAADVKNNGDGTFTVTFREFCPVAFFTEAASPEPRTLSTQGGSTVPAGAQTLSAQKDAPDSALWGAAVAVGAAAAVVAGAFAGKKKERREKNTSTSAKL